MNAPVAGFELLRQPPASVEAEQSLLGALMLSNEVYDRVVDVVSETDFYRDDHRRIFKTIGRLIERGQPADLVTVVEALGEDLAKITGGVAYLGQLSQNTPSAANARKYAEMVREKSVQRALGEVCTDVLEELFRPGLQDVNALLDRVETKVFELGEKKATAGKTMQSLLAKVVEELDARYHSEDPGKLPGLSTGFVDLDEMLEGMEPADLIVIAGRPSMGKTAIAMNIAEHVAVVEEKPVIVFSLEMPDKQLAQRMLGSVARIDQKTLKRGKLSDDDWQRLSEGMSKLTNAPITIEETTALSIGGLRARARRAYREHGKLGLIVVDYIGLMAAPGETRALGIGDVTRGLKALAKELNIPIIALSQLNRTLDSRQSKRPILSDLRDSGSIEQDADKILFMYRDEEYNPDTLEKGMADVIVGKNRNGATGTVTLTWLAKYTRFENFAGEKPKAAWKPKKGGFKKAAETQHRADIDG